MRRKRASGKRRRPTQRLRARLEEAEATLKAIGHGEVDALVVSGPRGAQTLAIEGATHPYHVLLNAMSDGAALLDRQGTILFANRRLAEIARASLEELRGSAFRQLVASAERPSLETFLQNGKRLNRAREFSIMAADGSATPVWIALSTVPLETRGTTVQMAIITDLTERKRAEEVRLELMQRLISAEDDERRRIARELHDETGQSLTALLVGLRAIEDRAVSAEIQTTAQRLRTVASQTVDNVGRLARGLHPSVLDDMGLAAAVYRYVSDYGQSFGIAVDFRTDGLVTEGLPALAQTTMYRILQEALTNVARHARARSVMVKLKRDARGLELMVRDDGVGFDVTNVVHDASGLGLHGMRERVALLGGSVEIGSQPGQGTMIRARIPVDRGGH